VWTYLDLEVCVQKELELEALFALIAHSDDRLQALFAQSNAVDETKVERPCLAGIFTQS